MTLTKADLSEILFDRVGLNKREAKDMVEAFFEEIEDKVFNDLIDGVKTTEKPIVNENKDVKILKPLVNKKGETINVGDKVFLEFPKKGLFEVEKPLTTLGIGVITITETIAT